MRTAKALTDWHGEIPTQAAMAEFIDEGLLSRHVRKVARVYAGRHARIVEVLERDFADWLHIVPSAAGLHLCVRLVADATVDVVAAVQHAAEAGVRVRSLASFCGDRPPQHGVVLGYGAIPEERIEPGLRLLAAAFRAAEARGPAR